MVKLCRRAFRPWSFLVWRSADIPGVELAHFRELLALHDLDVLEALWDAAIVIVERGIIFQHAALYLEIVDAARECISESLENEERKRLAVIVLAFNTVAFAIRILVSDLRMLIGVRESVGKKSKQARVPMLCSRNHQNRKIFSATTLCGTGD